MRIFFLCALLSLSGCESLGEVIREKKYNFQVHETKNEKHHTKQIFGYNDDLDYIGFMVESEFR